PQSAPVQDCRDTDHHQVPARPRDPRHRICCACHGRARGGFLLGANYEGPPDQAWQMWHDDRFDPTLIAQDFARARAADLTVLRIFVQAPLADDVRANRWAKLDHVLDLADRAGLRLIVTFADYTEWDLTRLAEVDAAIAARYKGRPTILAFDLKNEPRIGDLALSTYPGIPPSLQQASLIDAIKPLLPVAADARTGLEWLSRQEIAEYRASEEGRRTVPARLDDEQAYVYVNAVRAYRKLLADAGAWVGQHQGGTSVRYLQSEDAAAWQPLITALNDTLAAYVAPRLAAIRQADPERLVTVAHVDANLAVMPVNAWLDYRTFHRYPPSPTSNGVKAALALWDDILAAVPDRPLVLGEFGFANDTVDEATTAALEVELVRGIRDRGGAGALKWMLNDFPSGANPRENSFGMFRGDGTAKPVVAAFQSLGALELAEGVTALDALRPAGSATRRLDPACEARGIMPAVRPASAGQPKSTAWAVVAGTSGAGVYLRRSPRVADGLTAWPDGTRLDVVGPDVQGDGLTWKQVRDPCGQVGWVPSRYAAPTSAP
ncbi:MAG: cellulase family glycosylhydrolase, partial [Chloroflexota bacterium]|nr:cellulase family glycosylhydrolase [Chloroflexota bacterium]